MHNRQELEGKVLLAASTLGIDVCLDGSDLAGEDFYALKRELIEGFKVDPVVATFINVSLKNGIDFDWLDMYEDRRALYQINLGLIQGIDMSFSKDHAYTALQLEAIRQWAKRGVDMSDLAFPELGHKEIRALAELKLNGFSYEPYVKQHISARFLRSYNYLNQKISHLKNKDIFLKMPNIFDVIRLVDEGIDIEKLLEIGFADKSLDEQVCIFYKLGVSCLKNAADKVKWAFDNIHLFQLQEFELFDVLITLRNFKEIKSTYTTSTEFILKALGVDTLNGDIGVYEKFFNSDSNQYYDVKTIYCLRSGLDISFALDNKVAEAIRSSIFYILYFMIEKQTDINLIQKARDIFEQSLSVISNPSLVFKRMNNLLWENIKDYSVVDFGVLLDVSIPDEFKNEAIVAKKNGITYEEIRNLKLTKYQLMYLLNKDINKTFLDVINMGFVNIENLKELNEAASCLDLHEFKNIESKSDNISILIHFNSLKHKNGFYLLSDHSFCCDTVFLAIDALRLDVDIYPYVKDQNDFYAKKNLQLIIEKELNVKDFKSRSQNEFELGKDSLSDMYPL